MRRVILPQALVEMVPSFNNLFIQLLKGSALLTLITAHEIVHQARRVLMIRHADQAWLIWTLVLLFYLVLAVLITYGMRALEKWAAKLVGRKPKPRSGIFRTLAGRKDPMLAAASSGSRVRGGDPS
jgi:polar amino acid transport system permease protein